MTVLNLEKTDARGMGMDGSFGKFMSPISPVFHTEVTVSIGLENHSKRLVREKMRESAYCL